MKALIAILLLASSSAMAQTSDVIQSRPDDFYVDFISWCEENNVMGYDSNNQVYVRANCSTQGQACYQAVTHRHNRTIYSAACVNK
ncbi:hypothetical protein EZJ49_01675 [Bdellovibrio bacteriovorus]|uniref:hypothetical protein n=1 Tax=Bdellovibrio bacteriovorus TaxID=959 RepID=UPI0021D3A3C4|nr:hypothetical protein [Bdellovibrio bacteriovorus]UXR64958.1 hypothetical protein EZJ49_01675 [Bdellovibrio bacteriovorus]